MSLIQSTASNEMVFLVLSSDSKTGATGKTLTIEISKNGGAFAGISPTVTERGDGWYNIALTTSHTDTLGDLAVHIEAADSDNVDFKRKVVPGTGGVPSVDLTDDAIIEVVDGLLKRDFSSVTGESARSMLNALRFLRNKWSVSSGTLTITKEDDSTTAWTASLTSTSGADPITGVDPA